MIHWVGGGKKRINEKLSEITKIPMRQQRNVEINLIARTDDELLRLYYYRG